MLISGGQERCPTGKVVWGGGTGFLGTPGPGEAISGSVPVGTGAWEGHVDNLLSQAPDFRVDAFCANKPKGYKVDHEDGRKPGGRRNTRHGGLPEEHGGPERRCALDVAVGPGRRHERLPDRPDEVPRDGVQRHGAAASLQVYGVCAAKPAGYKIATRAETSLAHDTLLGTLGCPAKTSIVGGGVKLATPRSGMSIPDDLDSDQHGVGRVRCRTRRTSRRP